MVIEKAFRDVKKLALQLFNDGVLIVREEGRTSVCYETKRPSRSGRSSTSAR
jgi:hypothetical protein